MYQKNRPNNQLIKKIKDQAIRSIEFLRKNLQENPIGFPSKL